MYKIIPIFIFAFLFAGQAGASTSTPATLPVASPALVATTTLPTKVPVVTNSASTSTIMVPLTASSSEPVVPSSEKSTTTPAVVASSTDQQIVSQPASTTTQPANPDLEKLYGSVDPISLEVASTSSSTGDALAADDQLTEEQVQGAAAEVSETEPVTNAPVGFFASLKYLSSNVIIRLLGSLALMFLVAAIVFLLLSKRHERRNSIR